ncbi:DNA-binding protein [Duganella vulcania]|uniref:Transcriptional regulator n=1 Tax=Duganella vulcania TaxID=2692166 RepID=A0A845GLX1_9BURK|nr:DNA-binding protein [Duganella vulcania]MYM94128.1 transcriptional regulator [Duganella vulcania]
MSRSAIATKDQIRSTVLAMLTEAHDAAPATSDRFRSIVSVRKLKARLGGGDPATLGREIKQIESEIVVAGLSDIALPKLPVEIADKMQAVWHAAVAVQLDDVVKLKTQARESIEHTAAALADANLRAQALREELSDLRSVVAARDAELAQARTDMAAMTTQLSSLQALHAEALAQLQSSREHQLALEQGRLEQVAAAQERYEGLSKQLMQETAYQRQALQQEQLRVSSQLKFAERRIGVLEESVERTEAELKNERSRAQTAVGEANAFKVVNASMRAQLDELVRAAMVQPPGAKQAAPASAAEAAAGAKKAAPRRKKRE